MTQLPRTGPTDAATADVLTSADVESLLGMLSKSLRAFQMYQANNPVFHRFRDGLRQEFQRLWTKTDALELTVHENGFAFGSHVIPAPGGRESLAFSFYKDGVRFLKFLPGFEDEVAQFMAAVRRARRREDDADDMITVLWEEEFTAFQYGYVDLLSEGVVLPDAAGGELAVLDGSPLALDDAASLQEEGELIRSTPGLGLRREDFDETLYFLDGTEVGVLRREVEVEMGRDLRRDVLNALFDRLEERDRPERQAEIVEILDQLLPLFLSRGELASAARILEELGELLGGEGLGPELGKRIDRLFARLGDPEVLAQFVRALEEGAVAPDSNEVTLFFSRLRSDALPVLVRFAETSSTAAVRASLASAVDGLVSRHPAGVDRLLVSDDLVLVKGGARAAGRVQVARAVRTLDALLTHADRDVRMAVVEALVGIRTPSALQALVAALHDTDRDVRVAAARALGEVRFALAREALAAALDDRRLKAADLTEKMAFYEAFGAAGGAMAVDRLARVLNGRRFPGRRAPAELRACAALGLGRVGSAEAIAALEKGQSDDDPVVRNAVARALRTERGR